jgi:osmotically-inducible protein OsmY
VKLQPAVVALLAFAAAVCAAAAPGWTPAPAAASPLSDAQEQNLLAVYPGVPALPESVLARVRTALSSDARLSGLRLEVLGWRAELMLRGSVETLAQLMAAVEVASDCLGESGAGDHRVLREVSIVPAVRQPDDEIRDWLEVLLINRVELMDDSIRVEVADGRAKLTGSVASLSDREAVEDLVAGTSGIVRIDEELAVVPPVEVPDSALLAAAQLRVRAGVPGVSRLEVTCEHGVASVRGCVAEGSTRAARRLAERAVACLMGVRDAKIEMRRCPEPGATRPARSP